MVWPLQYTALSRGDILSPPKPWNPLIWLFCYQCLFLCIKVIPEPSNSLSMCIYTTSKNSSSGQGRGRNYWGCQMTLCYQRYKLQSTHTHTLFSTENLAKDLPFPSYLPPSFPQPTPPFPAPFPPPSPPPFPYPPPP